MLAGLNRGIGLRRIAAASTVEKVRIFNACNAVEKVALPLNQVIALYNSLFATARYRCVCRFFYFYKSSVC